MAPIAGLFTCSFSVLAGFSLGSSPGGICCNGFRRDFHRFFEFLLLQLAENDVDIRPQNFVIESKNNRAIRLFFQCSQVNFDKHIVVDGHLRVDDGDIGLDFLHSRIRLLC